MEDGDEEAEDDEEVEEEKDMQKTCERMLEEGEKARTVGGSGTREGRRSNGVTGLLEMHCCCAIGRVIFVT